MIVIGADTHKKTHTLVAVLAATGELIAEITVPAKEAGYRRLAEWAHGLEGERVFAIEDCRHVSGSLERFLLARGERVVRVAPKHMAGARRSVRERGKSDPIDALAIARAALQEGIDTLPAAWLDAEAMEIKLIADHREDLVAERTRTQNRLRWHLHDLWPELELPKGGLDRFKWLDRLAGRLARAEQTARVRVCREQVRRIKELTRRASELERELRALVEAKTPQLLGLPGCAALTAAKLIVRDRRRRALRDRGEVRPPRRRRPDPGLLGQQGSPPPRPRRQPPAQLRASPDRGRPGPHPRAARDYLTRKQSEGKSRRESLRCLKRQLVRSVLRLLRVPAQENLPPSIMRKMEIPNLSDRRVAVGLT